MRRCANCRQEIVPPREYAEVCNLAWHRFASDCIREVVHRCIDFAEQAGSPKAARDIRREFGVVPREEERGNEEV
jgi:hypothetical protein